MFCPSCGIARTGPVCMGCGYDYIEGARTPSVTLSRGINPMSLVLGLVFLGVVAVFVFWLIS